MAGQLANQMAIFENARERLFPVLDEDQYAIAESFLEQQESMMRMSMEMMSGLFDRGEDENADDTPPSVAPMSSEISPPESE